MKMRSFLYSLGCWLLTGASSFADSYNVSIVPGQNLIANQLDHGSNTLNEVFANVPDGSVLYKYNNAAGTWTVSDYSAVSGSWGNGDSITLNPGEGAYLQSPTNFTLTFTGNPHVPVLPVIIVHGSFALLSRQTNDIGTWDNIVGTSPVGGENVYKFSGGYTVYTFDDIDLVWTPSTPTANVGEAIWVRSGSGGVLPPLPVIFAGLPHSPLGGVSLSGLGTNGQDGLIVSNLGSSGQDGVEIHLPRVVGWEAHWEPLDPTDALPIGAYLKSEIYGAASSGSNGLLASWTFTKAGSSNYAVTADFSGLGVTTVTVQVYNGTNLVAQTNGQSGELFLVNGCVDDDHWGNPTPSWPPGKFGGGLTFLDTRDVTFPSGWMVQGDRLVILAEGGSSVTSLSKTRLTAGGITQITLTE